MVRGILLAVATAAVLCMSSAVARAEAGYAAGWDDAGNWWYAVSNNRTSKAEAEAAALNLCLQKGPHCKMYGQFNNTCFALAYRIGAFGFRVTTHNNINQAEQNAVADCHRDFGRPCKVGTSFCDTVSEQELIAAGEAERQQREAQAEQERQERELRDRLKREQEKLLALEMEAKKIAEAQLALAQAQLAEQKRRERDQFNVNLAACRNGSIPACDAALNSPAASESDRMQLREWRSNAASLLDQILTYLSPVGSAIANLPATLRALPLSTQITGGIAAILALTLTVVLWPQRKGLSLNPIRLSLTAKSSAARRWLTDVVGRLHERLATQPKITPQEFSVGPENVSPEAPLWQSQSQFSAAPPLVRDTVAAVEAMELTHGYMTEVENDGAGDPDKAARHLNTLSLASKQLAIAERADPDAVLTVPDKEGVPLAFTLLNLKTAALFNEGLCRAPGNKKRAIRVLEQAVALDPHHADAHYWIGVFNAMLLNKSAAVAAFEKAVSLDPKNIEYRKELERARNISVTEVAYDRTAGAVVKTVQIGRWLWAGFWLFFIGAFVIALIRQDWITAAAIWAMFVGFGLILWAITYVRQWFRENVPF